jgi:hypothetical protein
LSRRLLAVVVGFVLALLGLTLTAGPATAQNGVGAQPVAMILAVGPHEIFSHPVFANPVRARRHLLLPNAHFFR